MVPTHGVGIDVNKIKMTKGDTAQQIELIMGKAQKKVRNKSLSKTSHYKNPLRGLSPEVR